MPNPADGQPFGRYTYVNNNPIKYNDPTGHMDECIRSPICGRIIRRNDRLASYHTRCPPECAPPVWKDPLAQQSGRNGLFDYFAGPVETLLNGIGGNYGENRIVMTKGPIPRLPASRDSRDQP